MGILRRLEEYEMEGYREVKEAFREERTPHQVAASFAIGLFVTSLPSMGTGFLVFGLLIYLWRGASKVALLASAAILNPIVKPAFYVLSTGIGSYLYTGTFIVNPSVQAVNQFLVGAAVTGAGLSILSYVFVHEAIRRHRGPEIELVEELENIFLNFRLR